MSEALIQVNGASEPGAAARTRHSESEGGSWEPELDIRGVRAGVRAGSEGGERRRSGERGTRGAGRRTRGREEPVRRRILKEKSKNRQELRGIGARGLGNG